MSRAATFATAATLLVLAAVLTLLGVGEAEGALPDWQAFVLGIVQGLTELLPVSSSGHLILVPWLGDWTYLEQHDAFNQTFDVALHLGTLVAVIAYFRRDIAELHMLGHPRPLGPEAVVRRPGESRHRRPR